jgi:hypothetical protein
MTTSSETAAATLAQVAIAAAGGAGAGDHDEVASGMTRVRALEVIDPSRPGKAAYVYDTPLMRELTHTLRYDCNPVALSVRAVCMAKARSPDEATKQAKAEASWGGTGVRPQAQETTFNPPAVETIKWDAVMPELDPSERYVTEVILSYDMFLQRALGGREPKPNADRSASRSCRGMSDRWTRELRELMYVRAPTPGTVPAVVCPLFAVDRTDGKLRLIFDGRELNDMIVRPPRTRLGPIGDELASMCHDDNVQHLVTLDFKSWFVQLAPDQRVADVFFRSSLQEYGDVVVTGLPMGFAWAPVIAQSVATAFTRVVVRDVLPEVVVYCQHVYIDNIIFGVKTAADAERVKSKCEEVAAKWGIVIKSSSWEVGPSVTWRGVVVDAARGQARLVDRFVLKVQEAVAAAQKVAWDLRISDTIPIISCLIYATYVRDMPLASLVEPLRLLSRLAASLQKDDIDPAHRQRWSRAAAMKAEEMAKSLGEWWTPLRRGAGKEHPRLTGISDAAGPSEDGTSRCWAYAYHSQDRMVLHVEDIGDEKDIFTLELKAMIEGVIDAGEPDTSDGPSGSLHWSCDNLRALFVLNRGWSALWSANQMLMSWHDKVKTKYDTISAAYVQSACNVVDPFTRATQPGRREAPACPTHPGTDCPEFFQFLEESQKELCAPGRPVRRVIRWATSAERVIFAEDMPPAAMPL